jgi:adenylate cyclase
MYGNIGAPSRLDFTVIGPAVNLVSRIEGLCKVIGRTLLASDEFAQLVPGRLASLGRRPVRGLDAPVEVFGAPVG